MDKEKLILEVYRKLNTQGQEKIIDYIEVIGDLDKYKKYARNFHIIQGGAEIRANKPL